MKILITGGNGQVAYDLAQLAKIHAIDYFAPTRSQLDITKEKEIFNAIQTFQPDYVINTAAFTAVDAAENDIDTAFNVNCEGAKNIAIACQQMNIPLLQLSTDYIFSGKKNDLYQEDDSPEPLNTYGQSKLAGEIAVQKNAEKHLILRVSGVFGVHGKNFVKTILRLAEEREELRIVSDQVTCLTPSFAIAETLLTLCQRLHHTPAWGVYHYCGMPKMNWFECAKKIIAIANEYKPFKVKTIIPITSKEYSAPAQRPQYSALDCEKIKKTFGIAQPSWEEGVAALIGHCYVSSS